MLRPRPGLLFLGGRSLLLRPAARRDGLLGWRLVDRCLRGGTGRGCRGLLGGPGVLGGVRGGGGRGGGWWTGACAGAPGGIVAACWYAWVCWGCCVGGVYGGVQAGGTYPCPGATGCGGGVAI